jgi:hypothetical protein
MHLHKQMCRRSLCNITLWNQCHIYIVSLTKISLYTIWLCVQFISCQDYLFFLTLIYKPIHEHNSSIYKRSVCGPKFLWNTNSCLLQLVTSQQKQWITVNKRVSLSIHSKEAWGPTAREKESDICEWICWNLFWMLKLVDGKWNWY